jgi:CRP-like cAMP-binding protein
MDTVRALKQVIMFKDVPEPVLEMVAGTAEELSVPAGQTIISVRDTDNALYVIRHGTVRIVHESGKTPPMFLGTGETLGEGLFMDLGPAAATAIAVEHVDLFVFHSARVADVLAGNPGAGYEFYRAIARSLVGRVRNAVGRMVFAADHEALS